MQTKPQSYNEIFQPEEQFKKYPGWAQASILFGLFLASTTVLMLAVVGAFTVCKWMGWR